MPIDWIDPGSAVDSGVGGAMDKHERGWEVEEGRLDLPLPHWNGSYRGDKKHLPKVVQKLLLGRNLTPEEKAELLWRFHELDAKKKARSRGMTGVTLVLLTLGALALIAAFPPEWLRREFMRFLGSVRG
ncbi:MAG TPA: hypothetical protein VK123_00960 [Candidatus Limnocylindrales bacterium]|nr:hypothetical protein [Candidatus Limnocylindrales bacterium]